MLLLDSILTPQKRRNSKINSPCTGWLFLAGWWLCYQNFFPKFTKLSLLAGYCMCSTQLGKSKYYCLLCTCVCESNMASQNGTPIDKFSETNALQSPVLWSFFSLCVNFDIIIKKVKVHFEVLTFRTTLITCLWPNFIPFFLDFDPL